jgi:DNA-binding transcriptional MerR regulator
MEDLSTLKDIARRLDIPESNLRYYRNRIGDFLPSAGKGRRRRYFPEAEEIFRKTIEYIGEGVTLDRVYSIFAENKPLVSRDDAARPARQEIADQIIEKIRESKNIFSASTPLAEHLETLSGQIGQLAAKVDGMADAIQELKNLAGLTPQPATDTVEMATLKHEADQLRKTCRDMELSMAEKESVIERQKAALLNAREKRRSLLDELERHRNTETNTAIPASSNFMTADMRESQR